MAWRIEVSSKIPDARGAAKRRLFNSLGLSHAVRQVAVVDAYTIDKNLTAARAQAAAELLSHPLTEFFAVSGSQKRPPVGLRRGRFDYAVEISFLPGVTDNAGVTARESIADGLAVKFKDSERVYSSQIFYITLAVAARNRGRMPEETAADAKKIPNSLHNPLIQKAIVKSLLAYRKDGGFPPNVSKVSLRLNQTAANVNLDVPDEELAVNGKLGIMDPVVNVRCGPLALNINQLKAIQTYFRAKD